MQINCQKAGMNSDRLEYISDHFNNHFIEQGKLPGCQILVSRHGYPAYFRSLGQMDVERHRQVADDAIFRIYSMTKPITSVALMMLFEQGKFQLNDPVSKFISSWQDMQVWVSGEGEEMICREPKSPMTMRHLLSHTSGLSYGRLVYPSTHPVDVAYEKAGVSLQAGVSLAEFVESLSNVPLRFDPGTQWSYSVATDVCGYLVEILSGTPFDEFLQRQIFNPLDMDDTSFVISESKKQRLSACYGRNKDKSLRLIDDPLNSSFARENYFQSGGGGLLSTSNDYSNFCDMLINGGHFNGERIIGTKTIELMYENHLPNRSDLAKVAVGGFSETAYEGVGFGLGFAHTIDHVVAGTLVNGDYFWGGAASTLFWIDPKEKLSVIFMTQLMPSSLYDFRGQLKNIIYSSIES